jgi:hypothetical protein
MYIRVFRDYRKCRFAKVLRFDVERQNVEKISENVQFIRPLLTAPREVGSPPQGLCSPAGIRYPVYDSQVGFIRLGHVGLG